MTSFKQKIAVLCVFTLILAGTQGCDKITELTDKLKGKKKLPTPEAAQSNKVSQAEPTPPGIKPKKSNHAAKPMAKNVLATVGSWSISIEEFNERLKALKELVPDYDTKNVDQNKLVLEELINQQLIVHEAEKTGIAEKKDIVDAVEEFRRTLIVREMADQIVKEAKATEEEASGYYENNKTEFVDPVEWRIREIVVKDEETAKNIRIELYQDVDFQERVKTHSKAKSAWKKGDLGFKAIFDFPKMRNVVAALETGEVSAVFKGPEGFYIVKLEEKKGGEQKAFEDVKEQIVEGLTIFKQRQTINETLQELRNKTAVNINDKLLEE